MPSIPLRGEVSFHGIDGTRGCMLLAGSKEGTSVRDAISTVTITKTGRRIQVGNGVRELFV